jgi:hypothetical protein
LPFLAEWEREGQEEGKTSGTLCDDDQRVVEIIVKVVSRWESDLPLGEGTRMRFEELDMPADNLAADAT